MRICVLLKQGAGDGEQAVGDRTSLHDRFSRMRKKALCRAIRGIPVGASMAGTSRDTPGRDANY
jgi:hypothetical protein